MAYIQAVAVHAIQKNWQMSDSTSVSVFTRETDVTQEIQIYINTNMYEIQTCMNTNM